MISDPRFKQGFTRQGKNALGSAVNVRPVLPMMRQQQQPQPPMGGIMPPPMMPQGFPAGPMGPAMPADVFPRPQAQAPQMPMGDPRQAALTRLMGMGGGAGSRPDPTMKAIIDSMTGARVHKGMDGRQLGMQGVDPNIKYMLYAMRGRRHKGMQGQDIY